MNLSTKLENIKGVGPKTAELFANSGLETVRDLLEFFPRRYEDFSHASKISDLAPGMIVVRGKIDSVSTRFVRRNMRITTAVISDDSGSISATWFNQSFREKNLKNFAGTNQEFLFSGEFKLSANRYQLSNPAVEKIDLKQNFFAKNFVDSGAENSEKITPIYPQKRGLKSAVIRKILRELKPLILMLPENLPDEIIRENKLISRAEAVEEIHFPTSEKSLKFAKNRLAFEELFGLILAARMNKNSNQKLAGFAMKFDAEKFREIVKSLPFKLTNAQRKATWEIVQNFAGKSEKNADEDSRKNVRKVAVFDSGRGGELVSEQLRGMFPDVIFDDFNDRENLPYGSKTHEKIRELVDQKIAKIAEKNYEIIVIACNTATAHAVDFLREKYPKISFIGFEPAIKPAAKKSISRKIMILATPATLKSKRYKKLCAKFAKNAQIFEPDVSNWAEKIENKAFCKKDLAPILDIVKNEKIDEVVLGCTHYLTLESALREKLPDAEIIQPVPAVAKILAEILAKNEKIAPMNRLLQGDVGSGKTIVAGLSTFVAAQNNFQTALMAPTEILAAQHAKTLANLLEPFGIRVALLTGSVKNNSRKILLEQLKNGEIDLLVGTHALFQPTVEFNNLGFVIIDEQHRFGVKQRQDLLAKTSDEKHLPHLLAMTATPIPRSLQLTIFGDLDVSILDELPGGRKPIKTEIVLPISREKMDKKIREELENGRQIYFIAPNIEAGNSDKENVENLAKKVMKKFGKIEVPAQNFDAKFAKNPDVKKTLHSENYKKTFAKIGILHGKMDGESKEKIMRDFAKNETQILISTTVIEVGVDVPNASVMVIENADNFGLAQLHQLRGRVGRGDAQSYCFLVQSDNKAPTRRLREIEKSTDGFYLAEVDLELRGAGEIYGKAQHGALNLKIANLADTKMIKNASDAVDEFISRKISLADYPDLACEIAKYQRLTTLN